MNLQRAAALLVKDLRAGPRSPLVLYALVFPVVATFLIQAVFGSLFQPSPRLGIVDKGSSEIATAAQDLDGIDLAVLDSETKLRERVEQNDLDAGLVLEKGFDDALRSGEKPELKFYMGGESLAKNRLILAVTVIDLIRGVAGARAAVEVAIERTSPDEFLPLTERLLPLLVMFAVLIAGLFVPAASLTEEKEKGTLAAMLVTPIQTPDVLSGKGAFGFVLAMAAGVITLALNRAFGHEPVALVVILAIAALMTLEIGLVVGALAKDTNTFFAVVKVGNLLLFAPVIFFIWPNLPQWVAKVFPTYYFLNPLYEVAVGGATMRDAWAELAVALGICVVLLPIIVLAGRRMEARLGST